MLFVICITCVTSESYQHEPWSSPHHHHRQPAPAPHWPLSSTRQSYLPGNQNTPTYRLTTSTGGIAPNQVIARSEFKVHRQIYTEWIWRRLWLVHICDSGDLCRYFDIYPMYSVAFVVWWIITQWHLPFVDIWGGCKYCNWHFVWIWRLPLYTVWRYHTACNDLKFCICNFLEDMLLWLSMGFDLVWHEREREREMFYLTTHSTHFIYGYMASEIYLRTILIVRKESRKGSFICTIPQTG